MNERFGRFRRADYAKAVRTLVDEGRIERASNVGIKEHEALVFMQPPQQTMFG